MTLTTTDKPTEPGKSFWATPVRADPNKLLLEGHSRRRHWFRVPAEVTQDDVRHVRFWANCTRKLVRHDLVTIMAGDESWEMEACVERVLQDGAEISVRKVYKRRGMAETGTMLGGDHRTVWRAEKSWCVERISDGVLVEQGHAIEQTAISAWERAQPRAVA